VTSEFVFVHIRFESIPTPRTEIGETQGPSAAYTYHSEEHLGRPFRSLNRARARAPAAAGRGRARAILSSQAASPRAPGVRETSEDVGRDRFGAFLLLTGVHQNVGAPRRDVSCQRRCCASQVEPYCTAGCGMSATMDRFRFRFVVKLSVAKIGRGHIGFAFVSWSSFPWRKLGGVMVFLVIYRFYS
jgi:hypothetical protein